MAYTLYRHIDEPRFLTNLSHENIYAVNIFMRLNEFSSVRLIYIVRTCLKGLYAMPTVNNYEYAVDKHLYKSGFIKQKNWQIRKNLTCQFLFVNF